MDYLAGTKEAELVTGISSRTFRQMCVEGRLVADKIGRTWIINLTQSFPNLNLTRDENKILEKYM